MNRFPEPKSARSLIDRFNYVGLDEPDIKTINGIVYVNEEDAKTTVKRFSLVSLLVGTSLGIGIGLLLGSSK
jgi:hypothetical protein